MVFHSCVVSYPGVRAARPGRWVSLTDDRPFGLPPKVTRVLRPRSGRVPAFLRAEGLHTHAQEQSWVVEGR
jgi:hypothetical protein